MAKNYTTDKAKATRIKRWSAVLFVFSAAQLAIQIAVFVKFKSFYDATDQSTWVLAYNGMVIASGAFDIVCSFLVLCCLASSVSSNRETSSRCLVFFALTIALLSAVASVVVSALESYWINTSTSHPCQNLSGSETECGLWSGLEIGVAVVAAMNALLIFIIILLASKKAKVQPAPAVFTAEQTPQQPHEPPVSGEVTVQVVAAPGLVTEEHVSLPSPEEGQQLEPPEPAPVSIVEEGSKMFEPTEEILSYAQQLRKMTREELEREMARQFQIKFLKELRLEIDRRNIFSTEEHQERMSPRASKQGDQLWYRRSDASSVASSRRAFRPPPIDLRASSPPPKQPPTPDYDLNDRTV